MKTMNLGATFRWLWRRSIQAAAVISLGGPGAWAAPGIDTTQDLLKLQSTFSAHRLAGEAIAQVICSEDSTLFATTASDGFVRIWSAPEQLSMEHTVDPSSMFFNGRFIRAGTPTDVIVAAYNGYAYRWVATSSIPTRFGPHLSGVTDVTFAPRTDLLVTASDDGSVRFWSSEGKVLERTQLPGVTRHLASSNLMPLVASSQDTGSVTFHSPEGRILGTLATGQGRINALVFSPDQPLMLTGGFDGSIKIWTFSAGRPVPSLMQTIPAIAMQGWIEGLSINRSGVIAAASDDGYLRLWSSQGKLLAAQQLNTTHPLMSVCFTPDQRTLRVMSQDGLVSTLRWQGDQH